MTELLQLHKISKTIIIGSSLTTSRSRFPSTFSSTLELLEWRKYLVDRICRKLRVEKMYKTKHNSVTEP